MDCTGSIFKTGDIRIVELSGKYDSETKSMTTKFARDIYNSSNSKGYNSDTLVFENESIYLTEGLDDGRVSAKFDRF